MFLLLQCNSVIAHITSTRCFAVALTVPVVFRMLAVLFFPPYPCNLIVYNTVMYIWPSQKEWLRDLNPGTDAALISISLIRAALVAASTEIHFG